MTDIARVMNFSGVMEHVLHDFCNLPVISAHRSSVFTAAGGNYTSSLTIPYKKQWWS
jgi:hypothetical protein